MQLASHLLLPPSSPVTAPKRASAFCLWLAHSACDCDRLRSPTSPEERVCTLLDSKRQARMPAASRDCGHDDSTFRVGSAPKGSFQAALKNQSKESIAIGATYIPLDIISIVFERLAVDSLAMASCCCRAWHNAASTGAAARLAKQLSWLCTSGNRQCAVYAAVHGSFLRGGIGRSSSWVSVMLLSGVLQVHDTDVGNLLLLKSHVLEFAQRWVCFE